METTSMIQKLFGTFSSKNNPNIINFGERISLDKYDINTLLSENSIVYLQTQLAFPEDISVQSPEKDSGEEVIFEFMDSKGLVLGCYKYVKTEVSSFDTDKLINIYSKEFMSNVVSKIVHKTFIDGREAFIVTGKIKGKTFDNFTLVVIEGSNLTIFSLIAIEDFLFAKPDFAYKIFSSYKFVKNKYINKRIIKNFICFSSEDKYWFFDTDFKKSKGYLTHYCDASDPDFVMYVAIAENLYDTLDDMRKDFIETETPYFEDTIKFKDVEITCKGFVSNGYLRYYVPYKNNKFITSISIMRSSQELTRKQIIDGDYWNTAMTRISDKFYFNF